MKVILNKCYGGFEVSDKGYKLYAEKKNLPICAYKEDYHSGHYKKINGAITDNFGVTYFTKDFGDCFIPAEEDWKYHLYLSNEDREDSTLIEVVEELGKEASGRNGNLIVIDVPDGMKYVIDDYDVIETLHEEVPVW